MSKLLIVGDPVVTLGEPAIIADGALVVEGHRIVASGTRAEMEQRGPFDQVIGSLLPAGMAERAGHPIAQATPNAPHASTSSGDPKPHFTFRPVPATASTVTISSGPPAGADPRPEGRTTRPPPR